jgi:hypothetical protein
VTPREIAETAGARRVAATVAAIAARATAELPGAAVTIDHESVRLTGRGLLTLAFGDRRRAADPRLAALIEGGVE